jgi:hypothetical protein
VVYNIDLEDGCTLTVNVGAEGIIMDVYAPHPNAGRPQEDLEEDVNIGTVGMTFDEWSEWITS